MQSRLTQGWPVQRFPYSLWCLSTQHTVICEKIQDSIEVLIPPGQAVSGAYTSITPFILSFCQLVNTFCASRPGKPTTVKGFCALTTTSSVIHLHPQQDSDKVRCAFHPSLHHLLILHLLFIQFSESRTLDKVAIARGQQTERLSANRIIDATHKIRRHKARSTSPRDLLLVILYCCLKKILYLR